MPGVGAMSNRRRRGRNPWQPWTAPAQTPAQDRIRHTEQGNGRVRIDAYGADAGAVAAIDAFLKGGATEIRSGWTAPGHDGTGKPPSDVEVVWWFEVTIHGEVQRGESKPTTDHAMGVLEAAAAILRDGGGTFTVHRPGDN